LQAGEAPARLEENVVDNVGPVPADQDRVAGLLRDLWSDAYVRIGVFVGAATLALTWLITFVLGLIPVPLFQVTMLAPYAKSGSPFNYRWWAVWSLLGHFGGSVHLTLGVNASLLGLGEGSLSANLTGFVPLMILIGVMVLVGRYARSMFADSLGTRLKVLLSASVTMALIAGLVAVLGGYTIAAASLSGGSASLGARYAVGFGVLSFLLRTLLMTLSIGAFTLGVVELLPVPHRAALKSAARFALWPALAACLVFPLVVGVYGVRLADATDSNGPGARTAFMSVATLLSPAVGGAVVPMSFGSQATVGVSSADLSVLDKAEGIAGAAGVGGLSSIVSSGDVVGVLKSFSAGRIFKYASYLGTTGNLGAFVIVVAVLAFWVSAVRRYLGVMGSPNGRTGLRVGAYFGLVSAIVVALLALLLTLHLNVQASALGQGAAIDLAAGITGLSFVYIVLALTVAGAGVGYLQGTLRPTPIRYTLSDIAGLVDRAKGAMPDQYKSVARDLQSRAMARPPVATGPIAVGRYCSSCGTQFSGHATNFCAQCGAPRPVSVPTSTPQAVPVVAPQPDTQMAVPSVAPAPPSTLAPSPQPAPTPAGFCRKCGAAHRDASASFCVRCGAARVGAR